MGLYYDQNKRSQKPLCLLRHFFSLFLEYILKFAEKYLYCKNKSEFECFGVMLTGMMIKWLKGKSTFLKISKIIAYFGRG